MFCDLPRIIIPSCPLRCLFLCLHRYDRQQPVSAVASPRHPCDNGSLTCLYICLSLVYKNEEKSCSDCLGRRATPRRSAFETLFTTRPVFDRKLSSSLPFRLWYFFSICFHCSCRKCWSMGRSGTETVACFEPKASYLSFWTVPRQFFHTSGKFTRVILSAFLSLRSLSLGVYTRFLDSASRDFYPCRARTAWCLHERRVHTRRAPRSKIDPRTTPDMCVFLSPLQPGVPRVLACPTFASIPRVHRLSFPVCPLRRSRRFSSAAVPVRTHVRRARSVHACGTRAWIRDDDVASFSRHTRNSQFREQWPEQMCFFRRQIIHLTSPRHEY